MSSDARRRLVQALAHELETAIRRVHQQAERAELWDYAASLERVKSRATVAACNEMERQVGK